MAIVEIISQEDESTSQWQMDIVNARIEKYKNNSELMLDEDLAFEMLESE